MPAHDVSHEARDTHGKWAAGGAGGISEKAAIAKLHYKKSNKAEQRYGEAQEVVLVKKLRMAQSNDSKPFDDTRRSAGRLNGVEMKTKVNSDDTDTGNRVWMKAHALRLKDEWANKPGRMAHTVVFDHRDRAKDEQGHFIGNKEAWSGHEIYYKRGVGKYRLKSMYKVKDLAELDRLIDMPTSKLPKGAEAGQR